MAQYNFNLDELDSLGTLDKAQRKERLALNRKSHRQTNTFNPSIGESVVEGYDPSNSVDSDHTPPVQGSKAYSQSSSESSSSSQSEGGGPVNFQRFKEILMINNSIVDVRITNVCR